MSFLLKFAEFLLFSVVTFDTLGHIAESRKNTEKVDRKDFLRLCFTWVFLLALNSLCCSSCSGGYFGSLWKFLIFGAKVYVCIPAIRGTETLYDLLVEQNVTKKYLFDAYHFAKTKAGC
jgi:hypothetical protein